MKISRFFAFGAVALSVPALFACGGGGSDDTDAPPIVLDTPDAPPTGGGVDAMPTPTAECNPIIGSGCDDGEKCTWISDHTGCAPDGTVAEGDACMIDDMTNIDNCVAKTACNGVCQTICSTSPDSCTASGGSCVIYGGLFDDVANAGLCAPTCDPVEQDCVAEETQCVLSTATGVSACVPAHPGDDMPPEQDEDCTAPNSCAEGYGCHAAKPGDNTKGICTLYCTPSTDELGGVKPHNCFDAGANYECVYVNTFFGLNAQIPDSVGICFDPAKRGDSGVTCADSTDEMPLAGCFPASAASGMRLGNVSHPMQATEATVRAIAAGALH